MRKTFTLFLAAMFSVIGLSAQVLYTTNFATEAEFKAWTVIDNNHDEKTWGFDAKATPSPVFYQYHGQNNGDDWLISPEITPVQDGTLMVQYNFYGSSYGESMEVYTGKGNAVADFTKLEKSYADIKGSNQSGYFLYSAKANQPFNVAFRATTVKDRWRLFLCSVTVKPIENPVDLHVSEIMSPVTGKNLAQETVKVKIQNSGNVDVESFDVAFAVDGTKIATESVKQMLKAGTSMEYTFTAKADLSASRKAFDIKAWTINANDIDNLNDTAYVNVVHKAPASVPYSMGFEPKEYTDDFTYYNLNNDDGDWAINIDMGWFAMARTGVGSMCYNYNKVNNGNDWVILEGINVEAGYYVFKFWYSGDDTHPEKLALYYGNDATPEAMTNKVVEYAPFARSKYEESINIIHFDKPQTVYFGFYAFSNKDENWICVDDITFDKVSSADIDLSVHGISAPFDFIRESNGTDAMFEVRNVGIQDRNPQLTVLVDGKTVADQAILVKGQENKTLVVKNALAGLVDGEHEITVTITDAEDKNVANNTLSKKFTLLGLPVKIWDFETGTVPADFTCRAEDQGTVNPGAGEEFNEQGVGIFKLQKHPMLGENAFAMTSYLDGTSKADRWVVLPQMKVAAEGKSYLAWDVQSFNELFPENYEIHVSDVKDTRWDYNKEMTVTAESTSVKTRGLDLSKYAGKDIFIAFRLTTKTGDCLILDNIGLYGAIASGVASVDAGNDTVIVTDDSVFAGENAESIRVCDIAGRVVVSVKGGNAPVSSLPAGVYVATVKYGDGSATSVKFLK